MSFRINPPGDSHHASSSGSSEPFSLDEALSRLSTQAMRTLREAFRAVEGSDLNERIGPETQGPLWERVMAQMQEERIPERIISELANTCTAHEWLEALEEEESDRQELLETITERLNDWVEADGITAAEREARQQWVQAERVPDLPLRRSFVFDDPLTSLPLPMSCLTCIEELTLGASISEIPDDLDDATSLRRLTLCQSRPELPKCIAYMDSLEVLDLSRTQLQSLSRGTFSALVGLRELHLPATFQSSLESLDELTHLAQHGVKIKGPDAILASISDRVIEPSLDVWVKQSDTMRRRVKRLEVREAILKLHRTGGKKLVCADGIGSLPDCIFSLQSLEALEWQGDLSNRAQLVQLLQQGVEIIGLFPYEMEMLENSALWQWIDQGDESERSVRTEIAEEMQRMREHPSPSFQVPAAARSLPAFFFLMTHVSELDLTKCLDPTSVLTSLQRVSPSLKELQMDSASIRPDVQTYLSTLSKRGVTISGLTEDAQQQIQLGVELDKWIEAADPSEQPWRMKAAREMLSVRHLKQPILTIDKAYSALPDCIGQMKDLEDISLDYCLLSSLPKTLLDLPKLKRLDLLRSRISESQSNDALLIALMQKGVEIRGLRAQDLEKLLALKEWAEQEEAAERRPMINAILQAWYAQSPTLKLESHAASLPPFIANMSKLTVLDVSLCTELQELPDGLSTIPGLRAIHLPDGFQVHNSRPQLIDLILKAVEIKGLSQETMQDLEREVINANLQQWIADAVEAQERQYREEVSDTIRDVYATQGKALVIGKVTSSLPECISLLRSLEILDLSDCLRFSKLPEGIVRLPHLKELILTNSGVDWDSPVLHELAQRRGADVLVLDQTTPGRVLIQRDVIQQRPLTALWIVGQAIQQTLNANGDGYLHFQLLGERGIDAGGLRREVVSSILENLWADAQETLEHMRYLEVKRGRIPASYEECNQLGRLMGYAFGSQQAGHAPYLTSDIALPHVFATSLYDALALALAGDENQNSIKVALAVQDIPEQLAWLHIGEDGLTPTQEALLLVKINNTSREDQQAQLEEIYHGQKDSHTETLDAQGTHEKPDWLHVGEDGLTDFQADLLFDRISKASREAQQAQLEELYHAQYDGTAKMLQTIRKHFIHTLSICNPTRLAKLLQQPWIQALKEKHAEDAAEDASWIDRLHLAGAELETCLCGRVDGAYLIDKMQIDHHAPAPASLIDWIKSWLLKASPEQLKGFLIFCTGSASLTEDQHWKLTLSLDGGDGTRPVAHTCFYQLVIPKYSSEALLKERLDEISAISNKGSFDLS